MVILAVLAALLQTLPARAQGGPPFLTTDPGTPGNGNWEINVGATATRAADTSYQLPQLDVNFGLGERLQLSAEIPYVLQTVPGTPQQQGWGNALLGAKWRFLDQGGDGWQLAMFPQLETSGSALARRNGFAVDGPRLLLPLEVARTPGAAAGEPRGRALPAAQRSARDVRRARRGWLGHAPARDRW